MPEWRSETDWQCEPHRHSAFPVFEPRYYWELRYRPYEFYAVSTVTKLTDESSRHYSVRWLTRAIQIYPLKRGRNYELLVGPKERKAIDEQTFGKRYRGRSHDPGDFKRERIVNRRVAVVLGLQGKARRDTGTKTSTRNPARRQDGCGAGERKNVLRLCRPRACTGLHRQPGQLLEVRRRVEAGARWRCHREKDLREREPDRSSRVSRFRSVSRIKFAELLRTKAAQQTINVVVARAGWCGCAFATPRLPAFGFLRCRSFVRRGRCFLDRCVGLNIGAAFFQNVRLVRGVERAGVQNQIALGVCTHAKDGVAADAAVLQFNGGALR